MPTTIRYYPKITNEIISSYTRAQTMSSEIERKKKKMNLWLFFTSPPLMNYNDPDIGIFHNFFFFLFRYYNYHSISFLDRNNNC